MSCALRGASARSILSALFLAVAASAALAQGDPQRGAYLAKAGGCVGCHTETKKDAVPFAGGRPIESPFGTFYGPNLTPHATTGIGRWTEEDFVHAMRQGKRPDGAHYYPSFPYTSFTLMTDADLRDLWAYLRTLPASDRANRQHVLSFPFAWRPLLAVWKWMYFTPGRFEPDPARSAQVNRGAYLARALGHCGECHTPRNIAGAPRKGRFLAGGKLGEKGVPNLTPTRLAKWSDAELKEFLVSGLTPDGDAASETMDEVIRNTTSQLTPGDLAAMIAYLRALPPLPEEKR